MIAVMMELNSTYVTPTLILHRTESLSLSFIEIKKADAACTESPTNYSVKHH